MTGIPNVSDQLRSAVQQNAAFSATGLLERLFSRLFHGLVYPQIWEDPVADLAALQIGPQDNIVCIASGGCNVMSYLTADPASITAVDLSPAHVALGRLKLAAAQHLDAQGFFDFFGRADRAGNVAVYDRRIAPHLDPVTRAYWDARPYVRRRIAMFGRGFYRFGLLGRFLGALRAVARLAGVDFRRFATCATLDDQRRFFDARIAPLFDAPAIRFLARSRAALFGLGIPPAQYDKLEADGGGDILPVLRDRARKLLCGFPLSENYFARQALTRSYAAAEAGSVPPYLDAAAFPALRRNAGRVRVLNRSLTDLLAEMPASQTQAYVLLDAQDWMTDEQLNALWHQITRTAAPGARLIFRTGGAADILPGRVSTTLLATWRRDDEASAKGFAADRSAIYGGFHCYRQIG
ncbi:S-adenosylmethionine:diacylglycerol 3-amino-3-carboxypropyl transferase [Defluviimonas sp. 20V17]|uniref:S-adenosylmethionine--diacylglycerol 3-amino-3-carboxypropyl transferase n=1 Tax=Allgaiera indica TaxID=765699 RepID=A0AAN5A1E5_9RHOB|nr:DUF3419 family protein [Allgaiera indica]KDB05030.1 S-adenosylmethionine:diacylglycerol 3-amino-3-carboxypropyl transferase [Defluviimonas sp. 20V17]GHE05500.1 S-adenosylmethionine--diacylglycerol 3-amino-3-carboxypropyl transferase [Allgaiera indica]SDX70305.1 S-adenosylmethionine-diacylglycerol 3-amino-3-carboxypropyl transferase [Allgaiera indica]